MVLKSLHRKIQNALDKYQLSGFIITESISRNRQIVEIF
ncbi:Hypothetical protein BN2458_PEG1381 [Helicobacter typhlonius]|uniref:Uncharacterized protein n=1 Tax=Helicobacter typhlonius TaxID=76936 RepID=A0A0S4PWI9_9HELI|nr:Hypothetical protein BN2458_PEG1381 [Helicobacter typhlonius]